MRRECREMKGKHGRETRVPGAEITSRRLVVIDVLCTPLTCSLSPLLFPQVDGSYHFRSTILPPEEDMDAVIAK